MKELKRAGRGNDGLRKVADTKPGELAVKCIACPRPGINLPAGWENAPPEMQYVLCFLLCVLKLTFLRFLYTIFIAIDACFRLKRKTAGSWETDPPMCDGGSYFVESGPYREYCKKMKDQKEVSLC